MRDPKTRPLGRSKTIYRSRDPAWCAPGDQAVVRFPVPVRLAREKDGDRVGRARATPPLGVDPRDLSLFVDVYSDDVEEGKTAKAGKSKAEFLGRATLGWRELVRADVLEVSLGDRDESELSKAEREAKKRPRTTGSMELRVRVFANVELFPLGCAGVDGAPHGDATRGGRAARCFTRVRYAHGVDVSGGQTGGGAGGRAGPELVETGWLRCVELCVPLDRPGQRPERSGRSAELCRRAR